MSWAKMAASQSITDFTISNDGKVMYFLDKNGKAVVEDHNDDLNGVFEKSIFHYGRNRSTVSYFDNDTGDLYKEVEYKGNKIDSAYQYKQNQDGSFEVKDITRRERITSFLNSLNLFNLFK